jgi:hypothetical protein
MLIDLFVWTLWTDLSGVGKPGVEVQQQVLELHPEDNMRRQKSFEKSLKITIFGPDKQETLMTFAILNLSNILDI